MHNDHYETLQVSRNAHPLILTKAYRLLAALYHPDNKDTADEDKFRRVVEAYRVLADPVRRGMYDREVFGIDRTDRRAPGADHAGAALEVDTRVETEGQLRAGLLRALYTVRRNQPHNPGLSLMALTELLGCSPEIMQFTLWYLRGKKLIETIGDGNVAITVLGVDHIEGAVEDAGQPGELLAVRSPERTLKSLSSNGISKSAMGVIRDSEPRPESTRFSPLDDTSAVKPML